MVNYPISSIYLSNLDPSPLRFLPIEYELYKEYTKAGWTQLFPPLFRSLTPNSMGEGKHGEDDDGPEKYSFVYYEGTVILPQSLPHFLLEETSGRRRVIIVSLQHCL